MNKHWPADKVERRPLAELVPYVSNSRTHSPEQVDQIAASMREWGWTNPVMVDEEGTVIAGHGRILAAQKLGFEEVPVMVAAGWTEAQKRAYVIADNKLALNADWDFEILRNELAGLNDEFFDLTLIGYTEEELTTLLKEDELPTDSQGDDTDKELDEYYKIEIECENAEHQEDVFNELTKQGHKCKVLIL